MERFKIVRFFFMSGARRTIRRGLTEEQARRYCSDPETSSTTCTKAVGRARTRRLGPWFDGFTQDRGR